jgi:hypothetical protein
MNAIITLPATASAKWDRYRSDLSHINGAMVSYGASEFIDSLGGKIHVLADYQVGAEVEYLGAQYWIVGTIGDCLVITQTQDAETATTDHLRIVSFGDVELVRVVEVDDE